MLISRIEPVQEAGPSGPPVLRLVDDAALDAGIQALRLLDPAGIDAMIALGGRPPLRKHAPDFAGLASIMIGQQVSTASAAAIFGRLTAALTLVTPDTFLAADEDVLRACGLSGAKTRSLRALAGAIVSGALPLDQLASWPADEAHRALIAMKGIGPWTADVFLLFCLGHPDAWPAGDLALQDAARHMLGLDARPGTTELTVIGERWRPYRGVAAYLLWACYRATRGRTGIAVAAS